ncbi:MAG: FAD-dependent oxidoreductase [Wenzhouxiangellaceae bacterium]
MNIAIIGSGISGLTAAWHLHRQGHRITVFEAERRIGGHTHTHQLQWDGQSYAVDSGFIVFNDWTYPNFIALLDELGVESQPSTMSFSVQCGRTGLEYNGHTLNTLFAQRRNLFRPAFVKMIAQILRFNREAAEWLKDDDGTQPALEEFLHQRRYSDFFKRHYIVPMGAAIWSASQRDVLQMPARFFIRFFANHGMLSVDDRPQWRVVKGGSARYLERLTAPFADRLRTGDRVQRLQRDSTGVTVYTPAAGKERFDAAFVACHSDQALALLADPSRAEREVLSAIPYRPNIAVLHTDQRLLPRRRLAHAAWNYHLPADDSQPVSVTYYMNQLQSLDAPVPFLVTLNRENDIDPDRVIARTAYDHPVFTPSALAAQQRHAEINGTLRTFYCGAYWRNGFHEDGVVSSLAALEHFQRWLKLEQRRPAHAELSV